MPTPSSEAARCDTDDQNGESFTAIGSSTLDRTAAVTSSSRRSMAPPLSIGLAATTYMFSSRASAPACSIRRA